MEDTSELTIRDLRIRILRTRCIGSANCIAIAPEVFELDPDDHIVKFLPGAQEEEIERERLIGACHACPVDALFVFDEEERQIIP